MHYKDSYPCYHEISKERDPSSLALTWFLNQITSRWRYSKSPVELDYRRHFISRILVQSLYHTNWDFCDNTCLISILFCLLWVTKNKYPQIQLFLIISIQEYGQETKFWCLLDLSTHWIFQHITIYIYICLKSPEEKHTQSNYIREGKIFELRWSKTNVNTGWLCKNCSVSIVTKNRRNEPWQGAQLVEVFHIQPKSCRLHSGKGTDLGCLFSWRQ